jgi:hypothetical protein
MLISESYRQANAELHARNERYGTSGPVHLKAVASLIRGYRAASVLDYGAGKGLLAEYLPWIRFQNYDPAVPEWAAEPTAADLVICTDVLEHIEPECLEEVLDHLQRLTLKAIFLEIALVPAFKHLADGRNAHLIVEPMEWWLPKLWQRFYLRRVELTFEDKGFIVTAEKLKG